jgi:amino-acid N-acetyltransferase
MSKPVFRRATLADVDAILQLIEDNPEKILPRPRREVRQLVRKRCFWVVEVAGEIAGCGCLERYSRKIAELRTLAVSNKHRGNGLGSLLARRIVREARRRKIPEILVVTSNRHFFEKLNFGAQLNEKYALFWNG